MKRAQNLFAAAVFITIMIAIVGTAFYLYLEFRSASDRAAQEIRPLLTGSPPLVGYVHRDMYGERWPFTFEDGVVACEPVQRVIFIHDGVKYALNGWAQEWADVAGYEDIAPIWLDDPEFAARGWEGKISIAPLISLGLSLCEG